MSRGGAREKNGRFYAHGRFGKNERYEFRVPTAKAIEEAEARAVIMSELAEGLTSVGRRDLVRATVKQIAEARTPTRLTTVQKAGKAIIDGAIKAGHARDITIKQWGERYTSGELSKLWPDQAKVKDWSDDISRLKAYVYPHVGNVPVIAFTFDHASTVLSKLPANKVKRDATRRHVAQIMGRLMHLAVFPGRLITATPLPRGWLPKIEDHRLYSCLFPREETMLLSHEPTPIVFRLFCGVLNREGMRLSELLDSDWGQWNLNEGMFTTAKTKTNDPRFWVISSDVAEAMRAWRDHVGTAVTPFSGMLEALDLKDRTKIADRVRTSLAAAGVNRPELFKTTEFTGQLRAHDMRATFVTLALAAGKGDTWIRDRTAHKSTSMIDRYRRTARQFAELNLTKLPDLVDALGWRKGGGKAVIPEASGSVVSVQKYRRRDSNPHVQSTADFESDDGFRSTADAPQTLVEDDVLQRRDQHVHQSSTTLSATHQRGRSGTSKAKLSPPTAGAKGEPIRPGVASVRNPDDAHPEEFSDTDVVFPFAGGRK